MRLPLLTCLFALLTLAPAAPAQTSIDKAGPAWNLPWDADWVTAVSFVGPNRLAAGNTLGDILVWDLPEKTGGPAPKPVRWLKGHTNVVNRLISAEGRWLISISNDHKVCYWDLHEDSGEKGVVVLNSRAIADAASKKGKKAPAPVEVSVTVHKPARILTGHSDWVLGVSMTPDGKTLITGDDKGEIIAWDRAAGKELRRWKTKGWAFAIAVEPTGKTVFVSERKPLVFDSGRMFGVKMWDVETGAMKLDLGKDNKELIAAAAYSADGKWLAIGRGGEVDGLNGKVSLLDPVSGKKLKEFVPGHLNGLTDLAFHPDGKHLLSSGRDTTVKVWNLADGKLVKELGSPRGGQFKDWIHAVAVSPDGRWIAGADMAGQVQLWAVP